MRIADPRYAFKPQFTSWSGTFESRAPQQVEEPRRGSACAVSLAILLPARDDVVALLHLGHERRDLGGHVLAVAVHRDDDVAAALVEPDAERGRLAEVPAQAG